MSMSLKEKKIEELMKDLATRREELRGIRFNIAGSKARNVKQSKALRREVARILTEINRRKA